MTGGEVLTGRASVAWTAMAVLREAQALRRNGVRDPDAEAIAAAWTEAARRLRSPSAVGSAEVPREAEPAWSGFIDGITTQEAAEMLGISDRAVREQCDTSLGTARKIAGRWLIERGEILARAERKASA